MVSLFQDCARQGTFRYFSDLPKPERTGDLSLGSELHTAQEVYSTTGQSPPKDTKVGVLFRASLPYIAPPHKGKVEAKREIEIAGVRYVVLLDWQGQSDDLPGAPPGLVANLDFKTSVNPLAYGVGHALPPIEDVQAVLYSAYRIIDARVDQVFSRWLYLHTKNKAKIAFPSDFTLTKGQVEDAFGGKIYPVSRRIQQIELDKPSDPNSIEPNTEACDKYRGCPYAEVRGGPCRLTNDEKLAARARTFGGLDTVSLISNFKKKNPAPAPAPAVVETVAEDVPAINPPDEIVTPPVVAEPDPVKKPRATKSKAAAAPTPEQPTGDDETALVIGRGVLAVLKVLRGE